MKALLQLTSIHLSLFFLLLVSCSKPTEFTDYNSPYDELSSSFIPAPGLNTTEVHGIRAMEAWSGGEFTNDYGKPITAKGVCWSTEQNPTTEGQCTNEGSELEVFESHLTELESDQVYYVRAYATNADTTIYGGQREFTTHDGKPVLTTAPVTEITTARAQSGGEITDNGMANITSRGVCWSTTQNPVINDDCTTDGNGTGEFTSNLTGLNPDTKYFVRAYATNEIGTAYGQQREFKTDESRDTDTEVVEVTSPTGRVWMDRNLGASRAATSMDDEQSYGDLYQWGRAADGHQRRNSPTTTTLSSTDQPGHGSFILSNSVANWDWRSPQNNNLWQGVNGMNNPCPQGYRLPTEAEWEAERRSWGSNNRAGAFASPLKLPVAGSRSSRSGSLGSIASLGGYWSGTVSGSSAWYLRLISDIAEMSSSGRANGYSVRCIKD